MEKITKITGRSVPLPLKDIDTDMIIPADYLTSISRAGFGEHLFQRLRASDPAFPLNQERFAGASVLVADSNFGCGSSREHAVWALMSAGFKAVIAKSFADIFLGNSMKNGLVLVALPDEVVDRILHSSGDGRYELTIDLNRQIVTLPSGESHAFPFDPFRRHCIMNGLDDIDYIRSHANEIDEYRASTEANRFFSTVAPNRAG